MKKYMEILNKIAYENPSAKVDQFSDVTDPTTKKDLELIYAIQKYNDTFAEEQLIASCRGLLDGCVRSARATSLTDYNTVYQRAVNALKRAIRNYKLENRHIAKPSSFFITSIKLELEKLYNDLTSVTSVKMSETLNSSKKTMAAAEKILNAKLGRKPTPQEIVNFARNELNAGGNSLSVDTINRINHYTTMEYSGNAVIGKDSGAEKLTLEDVANTDKKHKIMEDYENNIVENEMIDHIREFTQDRNQRRFLVQMYGLGEFKGKPSRTINEAAMSNGLTYYTGTQLLAGFNSFLDKKGVK